MGKNISKAKTEIPYGVRCYTRHNRNSIRIIYEITYGKYRLANFTELEHAITARRILEQHNPPRNDKQRLIEYYANLVKTQQAPMPNIRRNTCSLWAKLLPEHNHD